MKVLTLCELDRHIRQCEVCQKTPYRVMNVIREAVEYGLREVYQENGRSHLGIREPVKQ